MIARWKPATRMRKAKNRRNSRKCEDWGEKEENWRSVSFREFFEILTKIEWTEHSAQGGFTKLRIAEYEGGWTLAHLFHWCH